ncbi:MAG TPA: hypothetical protein VFC46_12160 [Humisphaera sp.]|nr:hypothetical protein [Humisphaera sp.]
MTNIHITRGLAAADGDSADSGDGFANAGHASYSNSLGPSAIGAVVTETEGPRDVVGVCGFTELRLIGWR